MHIMTDLETMAKKPGGIVPAIGAVAFDPVTGEIGETFYRTITMASCEAVGLRFDASTVEFWLRQSDAARLALLDGAAPLVGVLEHFSAWYAQVGGAQVWGHGGNFDEPMLAVAYGAAGLRTPWSYSAGRCTRTLYELAGVTPDRSAGVHHKALDDAMNQALAAIEAYRILGLARPDPTEVVGA